MRCGCGCSAVAGLADLTVGDTQAGWWNDWRFVAAIILAMAIPLLLPTIPPLVDLPGHMGRYEVQLNIDSSAALQSFYSFQWQLIGNLGIDLLVIPLAPIFGLELAVKLIIITIPVMTAGGMLWIAHEVHGRIPPTAFFALPIAYGHPFHFGFVNFTLSMALALIAFAFWLRLGRMNRLRLRAILFVPIGLGLWVCHTFGWAFLGVLAFSAETVRIHDRRGGWFRPLFDAGIQCLSLFPPLLLMIAWRADGASGMTGDWFNWKAKNAWIKTILRDRWETFDLASVYILFAVIGIALLSRLLTFSRHLIATVIMLLIAYILLPRIVFGSAYADMRLAPFILALTLIAIRPKPGVLPRQVAALAIVALIFFTVRIGATTESFRQFHNRHTAALQALNYVPREARLVSFVLRGCRLPWFTNRLEHLPALAIVRNHAFSNDQWEMAGAQLLTVKKRDAPGVYADDSQLTSLTKCPSEWWVPLEKRLRTLPRGAYDYVWLMDVPNGIVPIPADFNLLWSNGKDSVYRIESAQPLNVPRS